MKRSLLTALCLLAISLPMAAQEGKPLYVVNAFRADTSMGTFTLELFPDIAPLHVRNFDSLVAINFFDSTAFHRVIPGFVIQGGDPNTRSGHDSTWGIGDDAQATVPAEFNPISHLRGILSAARADDPNSATSQFFVCVAAVPGLDRRYSVYGRVIAGMDVVDMIVNAPTEFNQFGEESRPISKIIMTIRRVGIDTTQPGITMLTSPADGATRIKTNVPMQWVATPGAILYEVQLSKTPDFAVVSMKDSVVGLNASIGPLELGQQTYYWRVRASNGGRRGSFSEVRSFTTGIAKAVLSSPANSSTGIGKPVELVWTSVTAAQYYKLQLATSIGFTTILGDSSGIVDTSFTVAGLAPNTRYFWRVFAYDGAGDSTESARWNFTTDGASAVDMPSAPEFAVTALARDGAIELELSIGVSGAASVEIVDALGRVVRRWHGDGLREGRTNVVIDGEDLSDGAYFARATSSGAVADCRFVIAR